MPLVHIAIAGVTLSPAAIAGLQADTTRLMQDLLHKEAQLTVVSLQSLPAGALAAGGLPVARGAWLQAHVTAGTNSPDDKAAFIAAAEAMLRRAIGETAAPLYVIVDEVPAGDWGYDGRSQAARRLAVAA